MLSGGSILHITDDNEKDIGGTRAGHLYKIGKCSDIIDAIKKAEISKCAVSHNRSKCTWNGGKRHGRGPCVGRTWRENERPGVDPAGRGAWIPDSP